MMQDKLADIVPVVLTALGDPAIAVGRGGTVLAFNTPAHSLFPALRTGEPLALALRHPSVLDAVSAVLAGGDPVELGEVGRGLADGIHAVRVASMGRVGALILYRDLTEMRRIERMRVDFVANASHELRTPLAVLLSAAETLEGPARYDEKAQGRFLALMRSQAERMRRLVDDLLSLSRIEAKGAAVPNDALDLSGLVHEALALLRPLAAEHEVTLLDEADGSAPLRGDRDELLRLIENLVENAIRHGRRKGTVVVRTFAYGNPPAPGIEVVDDGPGIAAAHIPRLTERFYRVEGAAAGGTGLGLAIVKHVVQRHRGRLDIDSDIGKGTTFRVKFPRGQTAKR